MMIAQERRSVGQLGKSEAAELWYQMKARERCYEARRLFAACFQARNVVGKRSL
jgi:hypothetical protein